MHAMRVGEYELLLESYRAQDRARTSKHPAAAGVAPGSCRDSATAPPTAAGASPNLATTHEWSDVGGSRLRWLGPVHTTGLKHPSNDPTHRSPVMTTGVLVVVLHTDGATAEMMGV